MSNYETLCSATADGQTYLLEAPIISDVAQGKINTSMYVAFLANAYHHVRFTVPLMMAAGARLERHHQHLLPSLREYIDEEIGHERWILNDIEACGIDPQTIEHSQPNMATELLVSYVRDYINQVNPLGFFGMVHVLEGTSTSLATTTAGLIQNELDLPDAAFSYLRSHGDLDIEHVAFFRDLLDEFDKQAMHHVIHVADRVYKLYGDVLRSVPRLAATAVAEPAAKAKHVA